MRFESTAEDTASKRALIIRYNRAAISLKISEGDGTEFNYCETVAVQGLFFKAAENEIRAHASVI